MPVIGRLDGQVDEVIIEPISRRRRDEAEAPAERERRETPERAPAAQPQTPDADESSAGADELPVWLL